MAFHEVSFPRNLSFGAIGGPERRTEIVTLASGHEERNTPWAHARRRYDAGMGLRSLDDLETLIAFFEARGGQLHGFRWRDWADYKSCSPSRDPDAGDHVIGHGDGATREFQLVKRYRSGPHSYDRPITKPLRSSVRVALSDDRLESKVHWSVDETTGIVRFTTPPGRGARITAGFLFDVPVRFDTDSIQVSVASFQAGEVPGVPVVEVRV